MSYYDVQNASRDPCDEFLTMFLILDMMDNDDDGKDADYAPSRNRHAMRRVLCEEDARRRSGYIPRCALQHPLVSAFSTLYRSGDNSALITVTRFDHGGFQYHQV